MFLRMIRIPTRTNRGLKLISENRTNRNWFGTQELAEPSFSKKEMVSDIWYLIYLLSIIIKILVRPDKDSYQIVYTWRTKTATTLSKTQSVCTARCSKRKSSSLEFERWLGTTLQIFRQTNPKRNVCIGSQQRTGICGQHQKLNSVPRVLIKNVNL